MKGAVITLGMVTLGIALWQSFFDPYPSRD